MTEILHAFAGPLRKVDVDTTPTTPGVDVSFGTIEARNQRVFLATLVGLFIGGSFGVYAYQQGWWTFEQAIQYITLTPPANDN